MADVDYEGVACGAVDPAVGGWDVEVAGAASEAAHVAYPGGGVGEAVENLHGLGSAEGCINFVRGRGRERCKRREPQLGGTGCYPAERASKP